MCKCQVEKELVNVCWLEPAVMGGNKNEKAFTVKFIEVLNSFQKERLEISFPEMQQQKYYNWNSGTTQVREKIGSENHQSQDSFPR